jgi:hypothetical protein
MSPRDVLAPDAARLGEQIEQRIRGACFLLVQETLDALADQGGFRFRETARQRLQAPVLFLGQENLHARHATLAILVCNVV